MTPPEIEAIAGFLGISIAEFGRRYLRRVGGSLSLTEKPNHDCIFWDDGCTVYPVRPTQCRTFPFWPENLETAGRLGGGAPTSAPASATASTTSWSRSGDSRAAAAPPMSGPERGERGRLRLRSRAASRATEVNDMEFGIAVASTTESWRVVARAEELGFAEAWFYDTQLLNPDVFVCMALAAERTSRIRLATGVLIPSNRIAPVAANCLATLNRLAPGRIKLGVGTGFTGRRTMGLPAIKLADLREYLRVVQALLRGETIEWETEGLRRKIRFLNPDFGLINTADPIPLAISAFGPKARRLTAELGAEWLNFGGAAETAIGALDDMKAAWRDAGRESAALRAVEFTLGCVLAPGEAADSPRAKAQAGTLVAAMLHGLVETPELDRLLGQAAAGDRAGARRLSRRCTSPTSPPTRAISRSIAAISCTCVPRRRRSSPAISCALWPGWAPRPSCASASPRSRPPATRRSRSRWSKATRTRSRTGRGSSVWRRRARGALRR